MRKSDNHPPKLRSPLPKRRARSWLVALLALMLLGGSLVAYFEAGGGGNESAAPDKGPEPTGGQSARSSSLPSSVSQSEAAKAPGSPAATKPSPAITSMEVAKAVMVTVELDFGPRIPSIPEALREIERRYQPEDGQGRTFAILDAYGEPTADGKLHLSMHVSSEKPGLGSLVFRPTGETLWQARILPGAQPPSRDKNLAILLDDGAGQTKLLDGSNNPISIFDARIQGTNRTVREFWPEGAERELTFIYSACGCPVKVMARRIGDTVVRTKDLPVIFPDDPAAVSTIAKLLRW